ncbi:DNA relaxase [Nostoc sp. 3335mG]|nr:DNA relaxase [Nostoc sp. 3335mG]
MIHPRRLKGTPANVARYYTVGDYYTKGDAEHSEWGGRIASDLGLSGPVDPGIFQDLLAGDVRGQQLGRRRAEGQIEHHPGWDFAVNAPKSVSIMALVRGDERIIDAHERAVGTAISYLEEHAELRRRAGGDVVHETSGRLLYARFTEHASRELDPHLHTHVVVLNMTNRQDGERMASLETRAMYAQQMTAGQVYRNDLAHRLRELSYDIEFDPRRGLFEIAGIPNRMIREMSQRAEQIDAHARSHGLSGQAARRQSFYETRGPKAKATLDELRTRWTGRAKPHEEALDRIGDRVAEKGEQAILVEPALGARATLFGVRQSEVTEAVNDYGRMLRVALASHVGEVRSSDVRPRLDEHEARRKLLSTRGQTGDAILTRGRTTRQTARRELALTEHIALAANDARPIASSDRLLAVLPDAGLSPGQERALAKIATSRDRITGILGVAGAGKSTLVDVLRRAAEPGTEIVALAPTSSAAANIGAMAGIPSRTVASLLASAGHGLTDKHVLVLDEAGQLGSRQAIRVLELSRTTGARVLLLGDDKQTGAIEQGKPFWLLQKLGMTTAHLTESMRQQTRSMKLAVAQARIGEYGDSLDRLDRVVSGMPADKLAKNLVAEWTRLKPEHRATTNILVLENSTRLIVNSQIRETLRTEGAIAAQDSRLEVLTPAGLSDEEKHFARFYSAGQVVTFGRDIAGAGIAHGAEYRVLGTGREANGRQVIRLVDANGRTVRWHPRLGQARHINVFNRDERDLAEGDRIQWRLANKELALKNAERGTVEKLEGSVATIRWDKDERSQDVDLGEHKTWDHGYAETVFSSQSKTYARVYVLAPVASGLVNGQNYYTAITRARFGVKLWTEDRGNLAQKLSARSGEKTSALEGLGRLERDGQGRFSERHGDRLAEARSVQLSDRNGMRDRTLLRQLERRPGRDGVVERLADRARGAAEAADRFLRRLVESEQKRKGDRSETVERDQAAGGPDHRQGPER